MAHRIIKTTLTILALCLAMAGCVTNNGDIGDLYGNWRLERLEIDGTETAQPEADGSYTTWMFQNNIVGITRTTPRHDSETRTGTWAQPTDKTMAFDFTHGDDTYAPGTDLYRAPEWLSFPQGKSSFDIQSHSSSRIVLQYADADGHSVRYTLTKEW